MLILYFCDRKKLNRFYLWHGPNHLIGSSKTYWIPGKFKALQGYKMIMIHSLWMYNVNANK